MMHRDAKADAVGRKSAAALLKGDIPKAIRLRKRSIALRGWAKRYSNALDSYLYSEPQI